MIEGRGSGEGEFPQNNLKTFRPAPRLRRPYQRAQREGDAVNLNSFTASHGYPTDVGFSLIYLQVFRWQIALQNRNQYFGCKLQPLVHSASITLNGGPTVTPDAFSAYLNGNPVGRTSGKTYPKSRDTKGLTAATLTILSVIPNNCVPHVVVKVQLNLVEIVLPVIRVDTVNRSLGFS